MFILFFLFLSIAPAKARDCETGEWRNFTECTCSGVMGQVRDVITRPEGEGKVCPALFREITCSRSCQKECLASDWLYFNDYLSYINIFKDVEGVLSESEFNIMAKDCNRLCDGGFRFRFRTIIEGSNNCTQTKELMYCNLQSCEEDGDQSCDYSEWSSYDTYNSYYFATRGIGVAVSEREFDGKCSKTCEYGFRKQYRHIMESSDDGWETCRPIYKWIPCNKVDCGEDVTPISTTYIPTSSTLQIFPSSTLPSSIPLSTLPSSVINKSGIYVDETKRTMILWVSMTSIAVLTGIGLVVGFYICSWIEERNEEDEGNGINDSEMIEMWDDIPSELYPEESIV